MQKGKETKLIFMKKFIYEEKNQIILIVKKETLAKGYYLGYQDAEILSKQPFHNLNINMWKHEIYEIYKSLESLIFSIWSSEFFY